MTWFRELLKAMTPDIVAALKEMLRDGLNKLYAKALETDNKWDDIGIEMVAKVFGIELEEPPVPE